MLFEYETDRLILRVLKPDQAKPVLDFFLRDQEYFEKYEPDRVPHFYSIAHQKALLRCEYNLAFNRSVFRYYIYLKEDPNSIIGTVCFHNIILGIYSSCEIGYKFSTCVQHKGIANEAVSCLLHAVFSELHLHRIYAMIEPDNVPSTRFVERLGFHKEGICREFAYLHEHWQDYAMYSLLSTDFQTSSLQIQ